MRVHCLGSYCYFCRSSVSNTVCCLLLVFLFLVRALPLLVCITKGKGQNSTQVYKSRCINCLNFPNTLPFCTHIEGNKDGWDGAGEPNPPAKEEHAETGYDGKDKAMIPRSIVALMHNLGLDHLRLGLHNHHIARLLLL